MLFLAAARSSRGRGQTSVTSRRPSSGGNLEVCRSAMVPIAAKVERQNILSRGGTSSQILRSRVALVKQEHSRTRLARREVGRLERSSVRLGQIHHPWCGCLPGKTRLFMSVFLAEYRESSARKLPEPVSRKSLGVWIRGGAGSTQCMNQPRPILKRFLGSRA